MATDKPEDRGSTFIYDCSVCRKQKFKKVPEGEHLDALVPGRPDIQMCPECYEMFMPLDIRYAVFCETCKFVILSLVIPEKPDENPQNRVLSAEKCPFCSTGLEIKDMKMQSARKE